MPPLRSKYSENKQAVDSKISLGQTSEVASTKVDGKQAFLRHNLVSSLIEKAGIEETENVMFSDLGVVNVKQQFALNVVDNEGVTTYTISLAPAENDKALISNLDSASVTLSQTSYSFIEVVPQSTIQYSVENIEEAKLYFEDQINLNLKSAHDSIVNSIKMRNKEEVSFRWDLRTVDDNGNLTNLKLSLTLSDGTTAEYFYIYNLTLNTPVSVNDLLNENTMKNISFKSDRVYLTNYNKAIQGTKDALIDAIAKVAITDGYDYNAEDVTKIYIDKVALKNSTLGEVHSFNIILISSEGVREQNIIIKTSISGADYIKQIEQGNYIVSSNNLKSVDFSQNILNEHTSEDIEVLNENEEAYCLA